MCYADLGETNSTSRNKSTRVDYLAVSSDLSPSPSGGTLGRHSGGSTSDRRTKVTFRDQHRFAAEYSKRGTVCKRRCRLLRSNGKAKVPELRIRPNSASVPAWLELSYVSTDRGATLELQMYRWATLVAFKERCIRTCVE